MPVLSRWFIRTALIALIAGLATATLGVLVFLATTAPRLKPFGAGR